MCEFVSWIEKDGNVLFLTADDIYNTKRGKELQGYSQRREDYIGHGAIKFYFDLIGVERECTDFSSPKNFPPEIVAAIKQGKMRGLGSPRGLLSDPAYAEYEKVHDPAEAEYEKVREAAYAEYEKVRDAAEAEYEKVRDAAFWDLFSEKKNRAKAWK